MFYLAQTFFQTNHFARSVFDCRRDPSDFAEHLRGHRRQPEGHRKPHRGRAAVHGDRKCHHGNGLEVEMNPY